MIMPLSNESARADKKEGRVKAAPLYSKWPLDVRVALQN
jgi:hypothetical protein